jgi:probable F420-dependent oxidoreductase
MRVNAPLIGDLDNVVERTVAVEAAGYDSLFSAEVNNEPFFPLVLAAEHSDRVGLMTAITVAFARNPMTLANQAHDLNSFSKGRLTLGLGSQIRPHITRRFNMPWSRPASRMREIILAMRAIWDCWYEGKPLRFEGEFYTHTLMTPMFIPSNLEHGPPRVALAGVGPRMTEVAGEVADGLIAHAFTTRRYMETVTLPALARGLERAGRMRSEFEVACPSFVISGMDEQAREASSRAVRQQIAFYGSTPAYRPVLELHGWGELQEELNRLSKQGKWEEMGERIDDDVLEEFAIVAAPGEIASKLSDRWSGLIDTWLCTHELTNPDAQAEIVSRLQETPVRP